MSSSRTSFFGILSALAALSNAAPAPAPVPAGGPQGPGLFLPAGTIMNFAQLQPSDFNYLSYALPSLHPPQRVPAFINTTAVDPVEFVTFRSTNDTDAAGNAALTSAVDGYGITTVEGLVYLEQGKPTTGWTYNGGYLNNRESAPNGLYACEIPPDPSTSAAQGTVGVEDASHSHQNAQNGKCFDATFVYFAAQS